MKLYSLVFVILASTLTGMPVEAQPLNHHRLLASRNSALSLDQAVQQVKQETGGRILTAKTVGRGAKQRHVIKVLLPSGKVRIVKINAQ